MCTVLTSSSWEFLWNSGKNVRVIFGERKRNTSFFSLGLDFLWTAASAEVSLHLSHASLSHLCSPSPPATHFNPINDPSPTTRQIVFFTRRCYFSLTCCDQWRGFPPNTLLLWRFLAKLKFNSSCLWPCAALFRLQPNQISMDENILVSRYINNPLLIDGEWLQTQLLQSLFGK